VLLHHPNEHYAPQVQTSPWLYRKRLCRFCHRARNPQPPSHDIEGYIILASTADYDFNVDSDADAWAGN